jgi:hypothetical protein
MREQDFGDDALREQLAGYYVAWCDGEVVLKTETSDELYRRLNQLPRDVQERVVIEYVRRTDVIYI